jgi:uncharacterized protein
MGAFLVLLAVLVSLVLGCVLLVLGRYFLQEFTRPGVTVEPGTPQWGGWTFPQLAGEPAEQLQRALTFQSTGGVLLRGEFWAQTHRAPTIVISHGFHFPSFYFRTMATLGYAQGANILFFDYRGHGQSERVATTCGTAEVGDLLAAVNIASNQPETALERVYILGFSMGAAVALLLPPHPAVAGIIADSPYACLDEVIRSQVCQALDQAICGWPAPARVARVLLPVLTRLLLLGGQLLFRLRSRCSLMARPDLRIGDHRAWPCSGRAAPPILLIHAKEDPLISLDHAHRLVAAARAAGRPIDEYYTPCAIHCGSYGHDPHRYLALLKAFVAL